MRMWQVSLIMVVAVAAIIGLVAGTASPQNTPPPQLKMDDLTVKPEKAPPGEAVSEKPLTERRVPPARIEFDALAKRVAKLETEVQDLKKQVTALSAPKPAEKAARTGGGQ